MKLDYTKIEAQKIEKFKGGEGYIEAFMYVDDDNRILKGKLNKGCSIGMHTHDVSSEIIYIIKGVGKVICDGIEEKLNEGDVHYCPKGSTHTLMNECDEPLIFLGVVPNHKE